MSTMAKLYEFPKQEVLTLPKEEEDILELLGEAYVKALHNSLTKVLGDDTSYDKMEAVNELVHHAFARGMNKAIKEYEDKYE